LWVSTGPATSTTTSPLIVWRSCSPLFAARESALEARGKALVHLDQRLAPPSADDFIAGLGVGGLAVLIGRLAPAPAAAVAHGRVPEERAEKLGPIAGKCHASRRQLLANAAMAASRVGS